MTEKRKEGESEDAKKHTQKQQKTTTKQQQQQQRKTNKTMVDVPVDIGYDCARLDSLGVHVKLKTGVDVIVARLGYRQPVSSVNHSP